MLVATLTLLLLPKAVALGQWLRHPPLCRAFGGRGRLLRSAALELLLSMLFAPILMVQQSRTILSLCAGTTIGWAPQNRGDGRYGVAALLAFHRLETALGILLLGAVAARLVPLWLLPVALSLAGAVPVSWLSARPLAPALLRTPQDRECTPVQRRLFEARAALAEPAPAPLLGVAAE